VYHTFLIQNLLLLSAVKFLTLGDLSAHTFFAKPTTMKWLYEYIQRFSGISQQEFEQIAARLEKRHCSKKEILLHKGEVERYLYFIDKGLARKFFYKKKYEMITQIAKEGDLITSSVSFLSQKPSEYVVEALEQCTLYALSYNNLQQLYARGAKMERLGRLVTLDWLLQKEKWEHDRIRQEPRERFKRFMNENGELIQRVPQKHLASYLNMKPETFSRYKHLLRD
jgi:CRP-like cAMP-binding protein